MARTHGRIKSEVWEAGSDFRVLSLPAQWAYEMLISQTQISYCGVLPFTPRKWARYARGLTLEILDAALAELETGSFVVIDEDTGELLVRTFVKHDAFWKQPNLVVRARREFQEVESERIRLYLEGRHPWLTDRTLNPPEYEEGAGEEQVAIPVENPGGNPSRNPSPDPSVNPSPNPSRNPPRPRARTPAAPSPSPTTRDELKANRTEMRTAGHFHNSFQEVEEPLDPDAQLNPPADWELEHDPSGEFLDPTDPLNRLLRVLPDRSEQTERNIRRILTRLPSSVSAESALDYTRDELQRTGGQSGKAVRILERVASEGRLVSDNEQDPEPDFEGEEP